MVYPVSQSTHNYRGLEPEPELELEPEPELELEPEQEPVRSEE